VEMTGVEPVSSRVDHLNLRAYPNFHVLGGPGD
jgi:hypothetical protein